MACPPMLLFLLSETNTCMLIPGFFIYAIKVRNNKQKKANGILAF
jgi:hypothetical protein